MSELTTLMPALPPFVAESLSPPGLHSSTPGKSGFWSQSLRESRMAKEIEHAGRPQEQGSYLSLSQQRATDATSASANEAPTQSPGIPAWQLSSPPPPAPAPAQVPFGGCKTGDHVNSAGHHWLPLFSLLCLSQNNALEHCHWRAASCGAT